MLLHVLLHYIFLPIMRVVFHSVETHNSHLSALLPVGILVESELFFFFFGHTHSIRKLEVRGGGGQGLNPSQSCDLRHSCGNTRSVNTLCGAAYWTCTTTETTLDAEATVPQRELQHRVVMKMVSQPPLDTVGIWLRAQEPGLRIQSQPCPLLVMGRGQALHFSKLPVSSPAT